MKIKAVVFDVDWTLYDHKNKCFNKKSIEAVKMLKKKGILVFVCTARSLDSLKYLGYFDHYHADAVCTYNGAVFTIGGKTTAPRTFDSKFVRNVLKTVQKCNICTQIITIEDSYLLTPRNQEFLDYMTYYKERPYEVSTYQDELCTGFVFFCKQEDENPIKHFDGVYNRYDTNAIELIPDHNSKAEGIKNLIKHFKLKKSEIMSFGDDINDIDLFNASGYGVCMGNGHPEAKEAADEVTDAIWDDGVYNCLKRHKII